MVVRGGLEGSEGLLLKLVKLMMTLPTTSNYRYWITSCVHKWTQASGNGPHSPFLHGETSWPLIRCAWSPQAGGSRSS